LSSRAATHTNPALPLPKQKPHSSRAKALRGVSVSSSFRHSPKARKQRLRPNGGPHQTLLTQKDDRPSCEGRASLPTQGCFLTHQSKPLSHIVSESKAAAVQVAAAAST
ncbi:unnamed protein product, partial [Ectocarpus sp. 6 AP-2014]